MMHYLFCLFLESSLNFLQFSLVSLVDFFNSFFSLLIRQLLRFLQPIPLFGLQFLFSLLGLFDLIWKIFLDESDVSLFFNEALEVCSRYLVLACFSLLSSTEHWPQACTACTPSQASLRRHRSCLVSPDCRGSIH